MKLIGGPMDGHEERDDVMGVLLNYPIMVRTSDAHCFSYRSSLYGPVRYTTTPISASTLGYLGPTIQTVTYSVRGQWLRTNCNCGEVVATPTIEGEDPPGPPRAHPPAR